MLNTAPLLSYVFVTTFTPGPNNIMAMANAHRFGFKSALRFIVGVVAGFTVLMALCGALNLLLAAFIPKAQVIMEPLGAAYMLYLAYKMFTVKETAAGAASEVLCSVKTGFMLQFVNAKAILFGITVMGLFIIPHYKDPAVLLGFSLALAVIVFLALSCWALSGTLLERLLSRHKKLFNAAMAALLVYCAAAPFFN